jgi:glycosyltransferase involved in cell wall biosynthesis
MNVVLVISNLEYGGAQRQVVEIASELPRQGFSVSVCSLSSHVPLAGHLGATPHRLHVIPKRSTFDVSTVPRLARLLHRVRADVVHGFLFDANIAVRLAGCLARTPLVIDSERNSDYQLKPRQRLAYALTNRLRHLCVANSHAGARFNSRLTGTPLERYRVIHNGVDTGRFRPADGSRARSALGLAGDDHVIGMFASFKRQKNHEMALHALARLVNWLPRARLLLVGDELAGGLHGSRQCKRAALTLIDELGIRDRCRLLGNRADVEAIYPACDVVILPSRFEGTPNVALEAMACGLPVVATDVADNARVIPDGEAGRIVPPADAEALAAALADLAAHPDEARRMGRFARRWIEEMFSREAMSGRLAAVYRAGVPSRPR